MDADATEFICFAPELLAPKISYAQLLEGKEQSDRWVQSLVLGRIACECFADAVKLTETRSA